MPASKEGNLVVWRVCCWEAAFGHSPNEWWDSFPDKRAMNSICPLECKGMVPTANPPLPAGGQLVGSCLSWESPDCSRCGTQPGSPGEAAASSDVSLFTWGTLDVRLGINGSLIAGKCSCLSCWGIMNNQPLPRGAFLSPTFLEVCLCHPFLWPQGPREQSFHNAKLWILLTEPTPSNVMVSVTRKLFSSLSAILHSIHGMSIRFKHKEPTTTPSLAD